MTGREFLLLQVDSSPGNPIVRFFFPASVGAILTSVITHGLSRRLRGRLMLKGTHRYLAQCGLGPLGLGDAPFGSQARI